MDTSYLHNLDIDFEHLKSIFTTLTSELSTPFVERRAKSGMHRKDAIDELADVLTQLRNTEKELFTAVEIAKMLMENNVKLKTSNQDYNTQLDSFNSKCKTLEDRLKSLRKKNKQLKLQEELSSSDLKETEQKLSSLQQDYDNLVSENFKLNYKLTKYQNYSHLEHIENKTKSVQDTENYYEDTDQHLKLKYRIETLEHRCAQYQETQDVTFKKLKELRTELDTYKLQNEDLLEQISNLKDRISEYDHQKFLSINFNYSHISNNSDTDDDSTQTHTKNISLCTELEELGETSELYNSQGVKVSSTIMHPLSYQSNHISYHFLTQTMENFHIKPRVSQRDLRKSPAEEYFHLVISK